MQQQAPAQERKRRKWDVADPDGVPVSAGQEFPVQFAAPPPAGPDDAFARAQETARAVAMRFNAVGASLFVPLL